MADQVPEWLKEVRQHVGLGPGRISQRELSRSARDDHDIPLSEFTMSEIMNGRMQPNSDFVAAVCLVLRRRPADLKFQRVPRVQVGWRLAELELANPRNREKIPA